MQAQTTKKKKGTQQLHPATSCKNSYVFLVGKS